MTIINIQYTIYTFAKGFELSTGSITYLIKSSLLSGVSHLSDGTAAPAHSMTTPLKNSMI